VIQPEKEPSNVQFSLAIPASQEFYFSGKMSKSVFKEKEVGKTIQDIIEKIALDHEMQQSIEMLELVIADGGPGKILSKDLKIQDVFERVWYPHVYKLKNPEATETPPFDPKDRSYKVTMELKYRLAGLDGEATEDRIDSLDRKESEAELLKRY
jgi:hypothetical protein